MRCMLFVYAILLLSTNVHAFTSSQSDWSDGPGVQGPVLEWSSDFYIDTGCRYQDSSELTLPLFPVSPTSFGVTSDFIGAWAVAAGDINSDGHNDIAATAFWGDNVAWLENDGGSPPGWTFHLVDDNYDEGRSLALADIDGDGDADLLGSSSLLQEVTLWLSSGGSNPTFSRTIVGSGISVPVTSDPVDIDGDGDLDILVAANLDDELFWMENGGGSPPSWTKRIVDTPTSPRSAAALDMDGDGDMDLCCNCLYGSTSSIITGYENIGGTPPSWTPFTLTWDAAIYNDLDAADVSGDGLPDLVCAKTNGMYMPWYENSGIGSEWTLFEFGSYYQGCSVQAEDLDQDGDIDILAASINDSDGAIWFENNGNPWGSGWLEHAIHESQSVALCCSDINGDGLMDIVTSQPMADSISWHSLVGYSSSGKIESSILDTGLDDVDWGEIDWTGETGEETSISFSVRSGQSPGSMGTWSDWFTSPGPLSQYLEGYRYVQYRGWLQSNCASLTPLLQDMEMSYNQTSIEESSSALAEEITVVSTNPSSSPYLNVEVTCRGTETIAITLYDCSGRLQASFYQELSEGIHRVSLPVGPTGVYFYRISLGEDRLDGRMVVI